MDAAARPPITRRDATAMIFGSAIAAMAGCGGGGQGASAAPQAQATVQAGPGLIEQDVQVIAPPSVFPLQLRSLSRLADGGFAIAWMRSQAIDLAGPWRLLVQRFDRQGLPAGSPLSLPARVTDPDAAATVLADGATLLAYRQVRQPWPDRPSQQVFNLLVQRFDPQGRPVGDPVRAGRVEADASGRSATTLERPALSNWLDGSFVAGWSEQRVPTAGTTADVRVVTQRFHPGGEPAGGPLEVARSGFGPQFQLQALDDTGGYLVSLVASPQLPPQTELHRVQMWNPLDESRLVANTQLLSLALCGTLLFTPRTGADAPFRAYDWQHFNWQGQADTPKQPVPVPALASQRFAGALVIQPLPYPQQFLVLTESDVPGRPWAQRMDKHGDLYGDPFPFQAGSAYLPLADTGAVSVREVVTKIGVYSLEMRRYLTPAAVSP